MPPRKWTHPPKRMRYAIAVSALTVAAAAGHGLLNLSRIRALSQAEGFLSLGFAGLAAETLDPFRQELAKSERGCKALIAAYLQARRAERLEWASEACIAGGQDIVEAHLGRAASWELGGRESQALQILRKAQARFANSPEISNRIAQIMTRINKENGPVAAKEELPVQAEQRTPSSSAEAGTKPNTEATRPRPAPAPPQDTLNGASTPPPYKGPGAESPNLPHLRPREVSAGPEAHPSRRFVPPKRPPLAPLPLQDTQDGASNPPPHKGPGLNEPNSRK